MPPPGPTSPTSYRTGATVVVVGATVVVVGATVVVVDDDFRVIVFVDVLAGYLLVFAIFNVNVHDEPVPIVSCVG